MRVMAGVLRTGNAAGLHVGGHLLAKWRLVHWPHVHGNGPIGLNNLFPHAREDDFAVGADQVVVTFLDMRADDLDM